MHRKSKKLISTLLALAMVTSLFTALPMAASATSGDNYITVSPGRAIKADGSLWAWGEGPVGDGTAEDRLSPVKIMDDVISIYGNMAIKTDGSLWAWGENSNRLIGDGTTIDRLSPVKVMENVSSVCTGVAFTAAVKTDRSLYIWGWWGQADEPSPVKIADDVASISIRQANLLAIKTDGSLWSWRPFELDSAEQIMDGVVSMSSSMLHTMVVKTDGSLWGFGANWSGSLGDGTNESSDTPIKIMEDVASVYTRGGVAGYTGVGTAAIKKDGSLWVWGCNEIGEVGDGTVSYWDYENQVYMNPKYYPLKIMDDVKSVSLYLSRTFAIKTDGSLWAWGSNLNGSLGDGYATIWMDDGWGELVEDNDRYSPVRIMDDVAYVRAGMAIKTDGSLWTWGSNSYGEIGDGTRTIRDGNWNLVENNDRYSPVKIMDGIMLHGGATTMPVIAADAITDETNPNVTVGVKLSWDSVPGVDRYDIYRARQGGGYELLAGGINGNTYVDLDIEPGATYTYKICPAGGNPDDTAFSETTVTTGPESAPLLPDEDGNMGPANGYILMQIDNPMMDVNGETVEVDPEMGTAPMLYRERTMLPIRAVVEAMGGIVGWDPDESKVTLEGNGNAVVMWIGNMNYTVNGTSAEMDIAPFIDNWRTFLPLRFAAENLNCRVTWINATREILIVWNAGN